MVERGGGCSAHGQQEGEAGCGAGKRQLARGSAGLRHWQSAAALPVAAPALGSGAAGLGLGTAAPSRKVTALEATLPAVAPRAAECGVQLSALGECLPTHGYCAGIIRSVQTDSFASDQWGQGVSQVPGRNKKHFSEFFAFARVW